MDSAIHIPPIPYDLLGPIFEHLGDNKAALCAISLASSTFRHEAQCILFREVTGPANPKKRLAFLRAVVASPTRLALFVHTYENREQKMDSPSKVIAKQALKAMRNLKCLSLGSALLHDNMHILRDCTFSLERFDGWASTSQADLYEWFLPRQKMLKHLGIQGYSEKGGKLPDSQRTSVGNCLQLVSIAGRWDMIEALLSGRKITTLSAWCIQINAKRAHSLEVELKCIKALSLSVINMIGALALQNVSVLQHFPSLQMLELTEMLYPSDIRDLHHSHLFFETLSSLSALQILVLSGPNEIQLYMKDEHIQFVPRLFDELGKTLKYIDVQADSDVYTRYTENSNFTEVISKAEVRKVWQAEPIA